MSVILKWPSENIIIAAISHLLLSSSSFMRLFYTISPYLSCQKSSLLSDYQYFLCFNGDNHTFVYFLLNLIKQMGENIDRST